MGGGVTPPSPDLGRQTVPLVVSAVTESLSDSESTDYCRKRMRQRIRIRSPIDRSEDSVQVQARAPANRAHTQKELRHEQEAGVDMERIL